MSQKDAHRTWRIGVAGLGTVGGGLLGFLAERPDYAPAGGRAVVTGVSARSRSRPRPVDISSLAWFDDPVALAQSPDIDIFVELVGGSDGPAKAAVEAALGIDIPTREELAEIEASSRLYQEDGAAFMTANLILQITDMPMQRECLKLDQEACSSSMG
jgi:hypothetical protein